VLQNFHGKSLREANGLDAPAPTPTADTLPRRFADFATLGEALDYAATGVRGLNFHDPRGKLAHAYTFRELRQDALRAAYRLVAQGIAPGDRVALIAETGAEFAILFFGAVYAGAWPVPLPLPTSFGGRDSYIDQLAVQLKSSDPTMLLYPAELSKLAGAAAEAAGIQGHDWESFFTRPALRPTFPRPAPTTSPICNIRAAPRAFRTASRSRIAASSTISPRTVTGWKWSTATAASPGSPGITTWGWSAACSPRSPTRSRPII
jgi:fatty-acyl-CoA synthase